MINKEAFRLFLRRNLFISVMVGLGMGIITLFLATIFPATDMENAEVISSTWPPIMKDLFGDPIYAFTNIYGWLYLQIFHITFWLVYGVLSAIIASRIVAVEIEKKTIDILLSTPLTRSQLILSRFSALFIILCLSILPTFMGALMGIILKGFPIHCSELILTFFIGFLLTLTIASITLLISIFKPGQISSLFSTLGILGIMFLYTESLTKMVPFINKLSFLSLFHFYRPGDILIHHSYNFSNLVILVVLTVLLLIISSLSFSRRDIYV